jgi:hypothetical protein
MTEQGCTLSCVPACDHGKASSQKKVLAMQGSSAGIQLAWSPRERKEHGELWPLAKR